MDALSKMDLSVYRAEVGGTRSRTIAISVGTGAADEYTGNDDMNLLDKSRPVP